jgi:hypothetical protein
MRYGRTVADKAAAATVGLWTVMLGFADAGMQEGKSENEERRSRGGPLYIYNGKKT